MPTGITDKKLNGISNLLTEPFFGGRAIAAGIRKIAKRFSQNFNKRTSEWGIGPAICWEGIPRTC
jgi:hypothetical protein